MTGSEVDKRGKWGVVHFWRQGVAICADCRAEDTAQQLADK